MGEGWRGLVAAQGMVMADAEAGDMFTDHVTRDWRSTVGTRIRRGDHANPVGGTRQVSACLYGRSAKPAASNG